MLSRNIIFNLPQRLWRVIKVQPDGKLFLHEFPSLPQLNHILSWNEWKIMDSALTDLAPAFVDVLLIESPLEPELTEDVLVKIVNSNGKIFLVENLKPYLESIFLQAGFSFSKMLKSSHNKYYLLYQKDTIPCCGS